MWKKIKRYFVAGLIAVLPLWVTYLVAKTVIKAVFLIPKGLTTPFLKFIPIVNSNDVLLNILGLILTLFVILGLGVLLTNVVWRRFFMDFEKYLMAIPLVSWIYNAIRKLTALFFSDNGESHFKRVVMLEYPRKGIFVIGFVTTETMDVLNKKVNRKLMNVFLPTTPNPTSGFLLMVPEEELIPLDISAEDAVKLIVSGGISQPGEALT